MSVTVVNVWYCVQGGPKKWAHRLMTIIPSNLNQFTIKITGRFLGKFVVEQILTILVKH